MKPIVRRALSVVLLVVASSCDSGGGGGSLAPEERDAFDRGSPATVTVQQATVVADSLFDFDPTIDPAVTPEANAQAIQRNTTMNLNGCGSATVSGATVSVSFGAAPGCTLRNGVQVSGSATATVARSGSTTTVTVTFTNLVVDGRPLSGTATFATTNGSTFTVTTDLTSGSSNVRANLTIAGETNAFTASGPATVTQSGEATMLQFNRVHYTLGSCYPDGGSVAITRGRTTVTLTFTAATASTGQVTVTQGRATYMATLPAYGSCGGGSTRDR